MTLGSAVTGFQGFPSTLNGLVVSYAIEHQTSSEAESGFGTYTSSGNTLSRTFRTYPTFGGSAVSFSAGTKHVRLTATSLDFLPDIRTIDPTATDDIGDGYLAGRSTWLNTSTNTLWFCTNNTLGAAVWVQVGGAGSGGHTIQEDGTPLTARTGLNFSTGLTATDDSGNNRTNIVLAEAYLASAVADYRGAGSETLSAAFAALTTGADNPSAFTTASGATYALTTATYEHTNAKIKSSQTNQDLEVPSNTPAGRGWIILPQHDGCIVSVAGDVGSVNGASGGSEQLVNGGVAIILVDSNPGAAPVVLVRGDIIFETTQVGGVKTYDKEDHAQDFDLTTGAGTQTMPVVATIPIGWYTNVFNGSGGNVTIAGADASVTLPDGGVVTVRKHQNGSLYAYGVAAGNPSTKLDAA
jgi:hypothetical protein